MYTTLKNTNKQNKYLFIHFENPSPHKTADDQFHFDQWTFVYVSLSWQIDQEQSQAKAYIHSEGHKIYTITVLMMPIIKHNVEEMNDTCKTVVDWHSYKTAK